MDSDELLPGPFERRNDVRGGMGPGAIGAADVVDGLSVRHLEVFGLWKIINDFRSTGERGSLIKACFIFTLALNVPYCLCQYMVYFFIDMDLQKVTMINIHASGCAALCLRFAVFWFQLEKQSKIYSLIKRDFLTSIPGEMRLKAREIYKSVSKTANRLCWASLLSNWSIMLLEICYPSFSTDYLENHTGSMADVAEGRNNIMSGWFPVPMGRTPYYQLILCYEAIIMLWDATYLSVFACMFYQPLICLYAHFCVLGHYISTLKADTSRHRSGDSEIYKKLYEVIKDHKKLIEYTHEIRRVYNPLVTLVLLMGIMVLITSVFQSLFGGWQGAVAVVQYVLLIVFQAIEVIMFCVGSAYIEEACSEISFKTYSSEWYQADIKYRKAAQMVMVRAKRSMTLTAIRMYPVNLQTLVSIFQFTYTTATLLSRIA